MKSDTTNKPMNYKVTKLEDGSIVIYNTNDKAKSIKSDTTIEVKR